MDHRRAYDEVPHGAMAVVVHVRAIDADSFYIHYDIVRVFRIEFRDKTVFEL